MTYGEELAKGSTSAFAYSTALVRTFWGELQQLEQC